MKNNDFLRIILFSYLATSFFTTFSEAWYYHIKDTKMLRFMDQEVFRLFEKAKKEMKVDTHEFEHIFVISENKDLVVNGFEKILNIDELNPEVIKKSLFLIFYPTDDDYYCTLKKIKDMGGKFYSLPFYGPKTRFIWTDKNATRAIDKTFAFGTQISHQNLDVHETICQCLYATKDLPGDYVEIGVYMGGSALTALHYMKFAGISRNSYFLDTFNGMTYQEAHNSPDRIWDNTHVLWGVEETMKYVDNLLKTTDQCYKLIESNICCDSLPKEIKHIAVCNLDVDLYEPTLSALEKIAPLIVKGGIIICEDPTSTPTLCGALLAMEEFLMTDVGKKFMKLLVGAQYLLIKIHD